MRRFFAGIGLSLLLAMWLEFFYKFGATHDPKNFVGALLVYSIYLLVLHGVWARAKAHRRWVMYGVGGFIGLMAEWFVIGNSPWGNPEAAQLIVQLGMFVFHAVYPVVGFMLARGMESAGPRRRYLRLLAWMSAISVLGWLLPKGTPQFMWFLLVPLTYYFIASVILLRRRKPVEAAL